MLCKTVVLGALYNLSGDQIVHHASDRLYFMQLLGLESEGRVLEAKTVWLYSEVLTPVVVVETLCKQFDGSLARRGYLARSGYILDASTVPAIKKHNTFEENKTIKNSDMSEAWANAPAKRSK